MKEREGEREGGKKEKERKKEHAAGKRPFRQRQLPGQKQGLRWAETVWGMFRES